MPRQILIVDDIKSNREILKNILGNEYHIIEAADGQEAIDIMGRCHKQISAVLLDLSMPVMDGFAVLSYMLGSETLSQLPVIVMTGQTDSDSEERALRLGAMDYIAKPYKSAIVKQRIWNTINMRETAAAVNALRRDRITGLYSRETFFEKAGELVSAHEPGHYIMACFDIDNFKVINDQYGIDKGDDVLRYISSVIQISFGPNGGICSRIMADNFAVLYPAAYAESEEISKMHSALRNVEGLASPITFSIGRYMVNDTSLSPSAMYDRAVLAERSVKGRYDRNVAVYDESMREELLEAQKMVTEMNTALEERQFEAWFQPQYNHSTGALIGAEALARWRHPEKGVIPPAFFIPIFEQNGFIYELDKYIWEEACCHLRKWIDEKRSPLPVSVNISRYDIFREDLVDVLIGLTQKYRIPVELLRLEITESAFAESTKQIVDIVKKLIEWGFTVEIDDFGSGYSSLNTLKEVPAQVIKLDMRFLEGEDKSGRGGNIIESIVRMAKWLGMSVIAEGVEEKQQADFLKSIGCSYVQGFLYARPMTVKEYEDYCRTVSKEERLLSIETVENLDNNDFWNPKSMDSLIFNSYVGAACIYEYHSGRIELLRVTDKYAHMLGGPDMTADYVLKLDLARYLDKETGEDLLTAITERGLSRGEETVELLLWDVPGCPHETWLRSTIRVIASVGNRYLVYCISENITAQKLAEQSERKVIQKLKSIMDNVSCGITATAISTNGAELLLANSRYFEMLGYTPDQFTDEVKDPFDAIYGADRAQMLAASCNVIADGGNRSVEYRAVRRDGGILWLRSSMSMTDFEDVGVPVQLAFHTDMTTEIQAEHDLLDNLPCGAGLFEYENKAFKILYLNKRFWELVNRIPLNYTESSVTENIHPDDRKILSEEFESSILQCRDAVCDLRVRYGSSGYAPFHVVGRIVAKGQGKYSIYTSYMPISDEAMSIQEMLPIALAAVMSSSSDLSFVKDKNLRYLCCSHAFAKLVGLEDEKALIGKSDYDVFEESFADKYAADDLQLMETGESIVDKVEIIPSEDGRARYSRTSKYLMYDSLGNVVGIYGTGQDITAERETKSRLELLTNNVPGGIAIYEGTPDALDRIKLTYFSDGFCRLFGYTREEYEKRAVDNPLGLVFPEYKPALLDQIRTLLRDNTPMDCIYRASIKGGGFKWINIKAEMGEPNGSNLSVNAVLFDVTVQQEASERLRMREQENRLAIAHSKNVVCRYDIDSRTLVLLSGTNPIFGISSKIENVPYAETRDGRISPATANVYNEFYERIMRGEKSGSMVYQRISSAGWRWLEANFSTIKSKEGRPVSAVISFVDVTDKLEKEAVYKRWKQSIRNRDTDSYSLYRCAVRKRTIIDTSEGTLLNMGFEPEEFTFDDKVKEYIARCVFDEDAGAFEDFLNVDAMLIKYYHGKRVVSLEYREKLPQDEIRWLRLTIDLVESPHSADVEAYMLFENIDETKRTELLALERAQTDSLTGVLNRAAFVEKVDRTIRLSKAGTSHALMMLDVDGFKQINDVFGHSVGDQTLVDIAGLVRSVLRHDDLIGRLGGDEFAVFLADVPDNNIVAEKAQQICAVTRKAFSMEVEISGSVGIVISPRDGTDFETLYKKADSALYYVKGSGRDNYAFYHEDMANEHLELEMEHDDTDRILHREKKRRMLIVDDNSIDYELMANIFSEDFVIEKAKNGNTALIRLRHYGSAISVVLLDLMMPGMDGFAVLEKMQKTAEMRSIPVIVVSGDANRETSLRAIRGGAVDFVMKPVDSDVLRIRVQSAISKAENERLRAKNSFLEYKNSEVSRYKTVLMRNGIFVIEYDWIAGTFLYDSSISRHIAGEYNDRKLWHILLTDMVADTTTVKAMQEFVHDIAANRMREDGSMLVLLKTPSNENHWFRMNVYKLTNEFGLTGKVYLGFNDLGTELPENQEH